MTHRAIRLQQGMLIGLGILAFRLVDLQLLHGAAYRRLADQNRLRLVPERAPRGLILDHRGRVMAENQTIFRVALVPQEVTDVRSTVAHVAQLVQQPPEGLEREWTKMRSFAFIPAAIVPRVSKDVALRVEEARWQLPGVLVDTDTVRRYPLGSSAAHLLGYLSEPTADELPLLKPYGVRPKELVGRTGVEQLLDHALRGRSGGVMVEVNHRGRQVRVIGRRTPETGARVLLTIDAPLQSLIEQSFGAQPGACVVLDPNDGAVLALVSIPSFPPEAFVIAETKVIRRLLTDPQAPLMNRATVGVYQPGSIAKLVTAAAALEAHLITPSTPITCPGSLAIGDRTFHCWNRDGHGSMTLADAIMQSCNVYFMQVGRRLGTARLRAAFEQVGFSHKTRWPLEEQGGHLPQRRLTEGEVALFSIGQGEFLVTPMQAAVMVSAFANGGWLVEPWMVRAVGEQPMPHQPSTHRVSWSQDTIQAVRVGMQAVVSQGAGTGHRAWSPLVSSAGKTGTAQTHIPGQPHGWFVGFCPVEHPRVALAIVVEHGGSGGDLPAEIAKAICEYVTAPDTLEPNRDPPNGP